MGLNFEITCILEAEEESEKMIHRALQKTILENNKITAIIYPVRNEKLEVLLL